MNSLKLRTALQNGILVLLLSIPCLAFASEPAAPVKQKLTTRTELLRAQEYDANLPQGTLEPLRRFLATRSPEVIQAMKEDLEIFSQNLLDLHVGTKKQSQDKKSLWQNHEGHTLPQVFENAKATAQFIQESAIGQPIEFWNTAQELAKRTDFEKQWNAQEPFLRKEDLAKIAYNTCNLAPHVGALYAFYTRRNTLEDEENERSASFLLIGLKDDPEVTQRVTQLSEEQFRTLLQSGSKILDKISFISTRLKHTIRETFRPSANGINEFHANKYDVFAHACVVAASRFDSRAFSTHPLKQSVFLGARLITLFNMGNTGAEAGTRRFIRFTTHRESQTNTVLGFLTNSFALGETLWNRLSTWSNHRAAYPFSDHADREIREKTHAWNEQRKKDGLRPVGLSVILPGATASQTQLNDLQKEAVHKALEESQALDRKIARSLKG